MNFGTVRTMALGASLLLLAAAGSASAQYAPAYYQQPPAAGGYPVQPAYYDGAGQAGQVAPASYGGGYGYDSCGGCGYDNCGSCGGLFGGFGFGDCGGYGGCGTDCGCGGYGCDACCGGMGPVSRFFYYMFTRHGPQGDGAYCRPRFFDVQFEVVNFLRDEVTGRPQGFYSDGIGLEQPIVLGTGDLDFNETLGVSLTGNYMISANTFVELRWLGGFEWTTGQTIDSTTATGQPGNLFSVFSDFGTNPNNAMQVGFPESDAADRASILYNTELNSGELSLRRRWVTSNCAFHYSLFMGARYVQLDERFNLSAVVVDGNDVTTGSTDYTVKSTNDMTGFQIGGDLLFNITKRIRLGGDIKAGIYGNQANTRTTILLQEEDPANPGTLISQTIEERSQKAEAAFVGEANLYALIFLTDRWTLRAGYDMFYLNGVALAVDNFNSDSTFLTGGGPRAPFINNTGDAFYHGVTGGFEFTW